ncbi:MAG: STAS domain-containing protein [Fervidobacterium sp.]
MYEWVKHNGAVVIKMKGELNMKNSTSFRDWVTEEFLKKGEKNILLDMSQLENLDSFALGMMISLYKRAINQNGFLGILAPNENIMHVLEVTGMDKVIRVFESLSQALEQLQ